MNLKIAIALCFLVLALLLAVEVKAHSWYDYDCCSDKDCAPVLKVEHLSEGRLRVTSKHGTTIVPEGFPRRPSQDNLDHVCINPWSQRIMCYYATGGY